eukprot:scaffold185952_cov18-Tisochrysis_lutea.AAC.2
MQECSEQQAQELKTCLCLAKTLLNSKRAADALVLIDRMVARFPAHIELLHLRGQALQAINNGPAVRIPLLTHWQSAQSLCMPPFYSL